jgi:hypothetical protein
MPFTRYSHLHPCTQDLEGLHDMHMAAATGRFLPDPALLGCIWGMGLGSGVMGGGSDRLVAEC